VKRRQFITLLGGAAAAAWPLAARAQQGERVRRVGVLMSYAADDPAGQTRLLTFAQALAQLGWTESRNVRIDIRWGAGSPERIRSYAAELVALALVQVAEPVGAGFVETLARRTAQRDRA
jgi:putative ABC transport system substrate-binding protein